MFMICTDHANINDIVTVLGDCNFFYAQERLNCHSKWQAIYGLKAWFYILLHVREFNVSYSNLRYSYLGTYEPSSILSHYYHKNFYFPLI